MKTMQLVIVARNIDVAINEVETACLQFGYLNDSHEFGQTLLFGLTQLRNSLLATRENPALAPSWLLDAATDNHAITAAVKQRIIATVQPRRTLHLPKKAPVLRFPAPPAYTNPALSLTARRLLSLRAA